MPYIRICSSWWMTNVMDDNMEALADQVDVIFTATPQGLCASLVNEEILSKVKSHRFKCGLPY